MSKPLAQDVATVLHGQFPATVCEHLVQEPFGTTMFFLHFVSSVALVRVLTFLPINVFPHIVGSDGAHTSQALHLAYRPCCNNPCSFSFLPTSNAKIPSWKSKA